MKGITMQQHAGRLCFCRRFAVYVVLLVFGMHRTGTAQEPGRTVLNHLRTRNVPAALNALGDAVDRPGNWLDDPANGLAAAGGGLSRALSQLSDDERYDLLYEWSLPADSRKTVRVFTTFVPQSAPPEVFARVLRERPRESSFAIPSIGGVHGLYSTGSSLVHAARDLGRLNRLTAELEQLQQQEIPGAEVLLTLARMADQRADAKSLAERLPQLVTRLNDEVPKQDPSQSGVHPSSIALAAAALDHEELRAVGEEIFSALMERTYDATTYQLRAALRAAHAVAVWRHRGESPTDTLYANPLKYWIPASDCSAAQSAAGDAPAIWLSYEQHLLHVSGSHHDALFFRFPLTGKFDFTCETQDGGRAVTDGSLTYGGLQFAAQGRTNQLTVWDADMIRNRRKPCPFLRFGQRPEFNRHSIRSDGEQIEYAANLHPLWFDDSDAASCPWIGLCAHGNHRPIFRNLKLTGSPVIPREVSLTGGKHLRGWMSGFYGESQPPFDDDPPTDAADANEALPDFGWALRSGVIQAEKMIDAPDAVVQSLLRYRRPLLDGESIRYEFLYKPDELDVHPALGRLAFLIEPGGVRIHWITDGPLEWTTLAEDNATLEPLNRRGPRPVPLKENDWNAVTISRADNKATLSLNGKTIYVRPVDFGGDHQFGFYRNRARTGVRIRNVVLSGDWPETVPQEFLQNPAATVVGNAPLRDRRTQAFLSGEHFLKENVTSVRHHAANLTDRDRYDYLKQWILPGNLHPGFRVVGEFTPTDPSPLALQLEPHRFGSDRGGELVSPVFDLLDTAQQLNRLDELSQQIETIPNPPQDVQHRSKLALQCMVALERQDADKAQELILQLRTLVGEAFKRPGADFSAELHLVYRVVVRHSAFDAIGDLLSLFYERRYYPAIADEWEAYLTSLTGAYLEYIDEKDSAFPGKSQSPSDWIPASRETAYSRGIGLPHTDWRLDRSHELFLRSGHQRDYLLYRIPLTQDYEVEGDLRRHGTAQVLLANFFCGTRGNQKDLVIGTFRKDSSFVEKDHPVLRNDRWVHYRGVVRDGRRKIYLNGALMFDDELEPHPDPWIGLRSVSHAPAGYQDIQISGKPHVPSSVLMSSSPTLDNWVPYFLFRDSAGTPASTWHLTFNTDGVAQIVGTRRTNLDGSHCESLLRYIRPLVEDGSVEYEFLYVPGQTTAHPALDRLAFLIEPEGVRIHWITDDRFDRTTVPPDNAIDEPQNRRGPDRLPLNENDWNRMKVALAGNVVSLELNGTTIYERPLEPTNARSFGLFHFADRTELTARNVVMRGDWPKALPPIESQDLTDPALVELAENRPKLKTTFSHSFVGGALPVEYFNPILRGTNTQRRLTLRSDGLGISVSSGANWTFAGVAPRFALVGDFDVEAEFDELQVDAAGNEGRALLEIQMTDAQQHQVRVMAGQGKQNGHNLTGQISLLDVNGRRRYLGLGFKDVATSGRFRAARKGNMLYMLFAEEDSPVFRLIRADSLTDADVAVEGVILSVGDHGPGQASVVWKNISIRAERLKYLKPGSGGDQRHLVIMNANGTNVRRITGPVQQFTHLGSPEFSTDGNSIVLDMSQGGTNTSHVVMLNKDGTGLKDLGPGCMPSLSPDGKQVVFSVPGEGIVLMNTDGTNRQNVDPRGWGVQFSPDGKYIAYGKLGNITLKNMSTGQTRELLVGENATRYSYIYWNLGWSNDGRSVAFKARLRNGSAYEVAVADVDDPDGFQTLFATAQSFNADFTFSPDNQKVLFAMQNPAAKAPQLYYVSRKNPGTPERLEGQPDNYKILDCEWSPDGKEIVFAGFPIPQPVDWPLKSEIEPSNQNP